MMMMAVAMVLLAACKSGETVVVERVKTDTLRQVTQLRYSIHIHDSTVVRVAGDTVYCDRWHTAWRERVQRDTVYQSRTDSIPFPVDVIREVPAQVPRWQQWLMYLGGGMVVFIVVAITMKVAKMKLNI